MRELVDEVLSARRDRSNRRRRLTAVGIAVVGHTALGAAIALAPALAARREPPPEFMKVMIVPAKALGEVNAPPRSEPPRPQPKPSPVQADPVKTTKKAAPSPTATAPVPSTPAVESSAGDTDTGTSESAARRGGPDGSVFGTSAFGSSEASFDDPNFKYGYYVEQMLALIGSNWNRPRVNPGTEMIVHYRIARTGELSEIEITKESGNYAFDLAGFRAVSLASPLPPLPQSYPGQSLGVNLLIK